MMLGCCECSPTAAANIAATQNGMSMSSISRSRILITRARRLRARKPMESVSDSTRPCSTNYRVAFRKKVYHSIDELQADLDVWIREYNEGRPHQGRWCFGKTPMQTFLDAMPMTKGKMIAA